MDRWLWVAIHTGGGGVIEADGYAWEIGRGEMAADAGQAGVTTGQGEVGLLMVKVCHAVAAVMAGQAIRTELNAVLADKVWRMKGVTGEATAEIQRKTRRVNVAGCAIQRLFIVIQAVPGQAEAGQSMVEARQAGLEQVIVFTLVLDMTAVTLVDLGDERMGALLLLDLCCDAGMAL